MQLYNPKTLQLNYTTPNTRKMGILKLGIDLQ
jgi:hypothetical protein